MRLYVWAARLYMGRASAIGRPDCRATYRRTAVRLYTAAEIAGRVVARYGLTPADIAIVEGK